MADADSVRTPEMLALIEEAYPELGFQATVIVHHVDPGDPGRIRFTIKRQDGDGLAINFKAPRGRTIKLHADHKISLEPKPVAQKRRTSQSKRGQSKKLKS